MRNALVLVVVGLTLWLTAESAQALGFGRTANATQLGQQLNFAAMIQLGSDESLARECVAADVFSGENKLAAGQIRVTLEPGSDPGERSVRITSLSLIDEPVVTINVTVGCAAKISRRFVAFIDPPLITAGPSVVAEPETLAPQKFDSQVAPLLAIVQAAKVQAPASVAVAETTAAPVARVPPKPSAHAPRADRQAAASQRVASSGNVKRARQAPSGSRPALIAQAKRERGDVVSRLQLEPSPAMAERAAPVASAAASSAVLAGVAVAAVAAASTPDVAKPDAQAEVLAVERERIRRLEEGTARLVAEAKATREALAQMQSRLQAAESERYANPLVYGLVVLVLLLGAACFMLWRRQQRAAVAPPWWTAGQATAVADVDDVPATAAAEVPAAVESDAFTAAGESAWEASDSLRLPAGSVRELAAHDPLTMPGGNVETSVDQLIDLEQQAEFFVVLGQDEAAIDLLMSHVRGNSSASPLPYLKLLEIYRRCDDHEAYDRMRARFNRRFDASAPEWDDDLQLGRSLADYPELLSRLQALWAAPESVMHALEAALFRRTKTDLAYDLPTYRELLFLFAIARDLSGQEAPLADEGDAVVDLLLPIDLLPADAAASNDMTTTRTLTPGAVASRSAPLDFDVSMPMGLVTAPGRAEVATGVNGTDPATASNQIEFNDVPSRPTAVAYQR